jgi:hypothetical protein
MRRKEMTSSIKIQCRNLGVADDRVLEGSSLDELIDDAERKLEEDGIRPNTPEFRQLLEDTIRSAVLQSSRPPKIRSNDLPRLMEQIESGRELEAVDEIIAEEEAALKAACSGDSEGGGKPHDRDSYDSPSGIVGRTLGSESKSQKA